MVTREMFLDEETDRRLADLAGDYQGDIGKAVADLVRAEESIAAFLDQCEETYSESLAKQRQRSEQEFRDGHSIPWEEIKRTHGL
jgi:hypothetical protein